jgi:single-strand DNA-binding protein
MNINKVILAGRVCEKPELKALPSGQNVVSFSLAINSSYINKQTNEKQENTHFQEVNMFGKQAEIFAQYTEKGQVILIEGRLNTRSWEDGTGKKQYKTSVIADSFQFGQKKLDTKQETKVDNQGQSKPLGNTSAGFDGEIINPEDIPF